MNAIFLNEGNIHRAAKKIIGLTAAASLALILAGDVNAQSKPAETGSAKSAAPTSGVSSGAQSSSAATSGQFGTAKPTQAVAQNPSANPRSPKGGHEGITVHGRWTIDVRNADGKVVSHTEFENSLASDGAPLLAAMLGRTVTTGSWRIILADNVGENDLLVINEPNSTAATVCPVLIFPHASGSACSNILSLAGPQLAGGVFTGATLTLTGSGTIPVGFAAQIGFVQTVNFPCAISDTPATCFNDPNTAGNFFLTARALDSQGTDPAPVPVQPGQMVSVTVVLSFGSGN
jgi:hypothetical protein